VAFKDGIKMGDGVRLQLGEEPQKHSPHQIKTQHAIFQEWKKKPHSYETTPEFRRNACSLCNLPAQNPIHLED